MVPFDGLLCWLPLWRSGFARTFHPLVTLGKVGRCRSNKLSRLMPKVLADVAALEALVAPVCTAHGVELVTLQYGPEAGGPVLRVLIELPDAEKLPKGVGVSLDDCTRVSRELSRVLDEHESLLPGAYRLEVGSAGVERPLVKARDFERYAGREVRLSARTPVAERKNFTGTLLGLEQDRVRLRVEHGQELDVPLSNIAKAHLVFRF
jgi:ribosome maturation factor RimP